MLDIEAMQDCVARSAELVKKKQSRMNKNREDEAELMKLTNGKTTLNSIFMNQDQIEHRKVDLKNNIDGAQQDLFDWE